MSFTTEAANKQFQLNIVIQIGSVYYSQYTVDSGLTVDADKIGLVEKVRINPVNVEIDSVRTVNNTASFDLIDKDSIISTQIGASTDQFLNQEVKIYVGFITGTFDFADYKLISNVSIKKISKRANSYTFTATEVISKLQGDIFDTFSILDSAITDVATTLVLEDAANFPSSGQIRINDEFIAYSGKTTNTLTGLSRGDESSTASEHSANDEVFLVTDTGSINPLTLLLQMIVSPGGGGTYDVLSDGLGIDQALVDVTGIEAIRDNNFASDNFQFLLYDIGNAQTFFENEILLATNTRFINKDGKISLALLDQIDITASVDNITESTTVNDPQWQINADKIVNKVIYKYNYSHGLKKFSRVETFTDDDSVATYGNRRSLTYELKGVQASLNGSSIVANRANRLLARLSTPQAEIGITTHFDKVETEIGDKINLTHRYIPSTGGTLGFNEQLEVLSRAIDFNTGVVKFALQFTSYAGLRVGLIAPSPTVSSITDASNFSVPDGSCYDVGYVIIINGETRTISAVNGNLITVSVAFTVSLVGQTVKFADYDSQSDLQKATYASIGYTGANFDDGTKSYQIIF